MQHLIHQNSRCYHVTRGGIVAHLIVNGRSWVEAKELASKGTGKRGKSTQSLFLMQQPQESFY